MSATTFPATRIVHTPSGPVYCCDHHAHGLTTLMNFLGAHVVHTAAHEGAMCSNCINESKVEDTHDNP